jgi:hypothetical protein
MHTHSPENFMKTGYPLGMVLYNNSNNIPKLKQLSTNQKVSKQTVKKILLEAHRHQ